MSSTNFEEIFDEAIKLFNNYSEWFGLSDYDFPSSEPQRKQCDFEDAFKKLICKAKGHDIGPDQCGKPEHDYCFVCGKLKTVIESGG